MKFRNNSRGNAVVVILLVMFLSLLLFAMWLSLGSSPPKAWTSPEYETALKLLSGEEVSAVAYIRMRFVLEKASPSSREVVALEEKGYTRNQVFDLVQGTNLVVRKTK